MLIEHNGKRPVIHGSARIAPNAVLAGDITVGAETSIGYGAVLTAESGPISIGANCVVMENAVLRGAAKFPLAIGWVAVGDPATILPAESHEEIRAIQEPLNFPKTVFGIDRPAPGRTMTSEITGRYSRYLLRHRDDEEI